MQPFQLSSEARIAIQASLDGGAAILEVYHNETTEVELKGDESPLTQADLRSNTAIMKWLEPSDHPVLSEEGKHLSFDERKHWSTLWIVDPLDGTKEFIKRNGEFTVNVALIESGSPVLGVVYVPVTGELYLGVKGAGAIKMVIDATTTFTDAHLEAAVALPVAMDRPFTAVGSRSHMNEETEAFLATYRAQNGEVAILSKGSSLKMCMVAEGLADVYPRFAPTMEWDTAAGQAVVEASGFAMLHKETRLPLEYNKEDLLNPHFIVL
ncbi:MAG: 3'(2'),5'-bisphosphate nucleotidase CysQ [Schleiferiaceae bacterium]|nr:3'(2'),5'-bisphosphate nucleotidase CysQ [Schleiferiaceae bacterium]